MAEYLAKKYGDPFNGCEIVFRPSVECGFLHDPLNEPGQRPYPRICRDSATITPVP